MSNNDRSDNVTDNILDRYSSVRTTADEPYSTDEDSAEDLGSFGYLRGIRDRSIMLELRFRTGDVEAFPYTALSRISFSRSDGITLHFGGTLVRITGQNLDTEVRPNLRLLAGILRNRVTWVSEVGPTTESSALAGPCVERIQID